MRTGLPRTLVVKKLEGVSKQIFRSFYKQVTELIGNSHGIYALYDENELYYIGKSTDLKNRVKQHLKDRHLASWTHFSLYLVRNADHISEIESLIIRVANPKGNRKKYKADKGMSLLKQLQSMVKQRQQDDFISMFGNTLAKRARITGSVKK
jgi:predicted GIY-YIG superfamily endonuclease